jgi:tetratricopeptide (TPR) repeat protein
MEARGDGAFGALNKEARIQGLLCEGESAYHAGDYVSASAALEARYSSSDLPLIGTEAAVAMWKAGQLETARHLLLKVLSGQDLKDPNYLGAHEILGEVLLDEGDPRAAIDRFEETLNGVQDLLQPRVSSADLLTGIVRLVIQHAYNNHGVALLWRAQNAPGEAPDCGRDESVCQHARDDFAAAISMDPNNPYYLQNAAWSDRLLNRMAASRVELDAAAAADPSDYPVLNDLGVMAAVDGELTTAQHEFQASLQARPDYDLAAWNLGVVDMQLGFNYIAAAQGYLARATKENPQLRNSPLQYLADNRIYRAAYGQPLHPSLTTVTVQGYSSAAAVTGGIAAFSALGDATSVEFKAKLTELLRDIKLPVLAGLIGPLRIWVSRRQLGLSQRLPAGVRTWLLTGLVLAIGTIWTVLSRGGPAAGPELILAVFATGLAVLVHECAHLIAACASRIRIVPAPSPLGILMSALLLPLRISSGPYAGHRPLPGTPLHRARWVYLAGPAANLLVAGFTYSLYLVQPFPLLQLIAGVQLAAAGFSLLPLEPLDGAALGKGRAEHAAAFSLLAAALALIAGIGGAAISFGKL